MTERSRKPVSVTLSSAAIEAASAKADGNMSRYVERLIMRDAVEDSVASLGVWLQDRPGFFEDDEAERDAAA